MELILLNPELHDRSSFISTEKSITNYLQRQAAQDQKRGYAAVYVATLPDKPERIAGYMALNARSLSTSDFPADINHIFGTRQTIPVVELGKLGVDILFEGQGLGKALIYRAIHFTLHNPIGVAGLLVKALSANLIPFYEQFGFVLLPGEELYLFLDRRSMA